MTSCSKRSRGLRCRVPVRARPMLPANCQEGVFQGRPRTHKYALSRVAGVHFGSGTRSPLLPAAGTDDLFGAIALSAIKQSRLFILSQDPR